MIHGLFQNLQERRDNVYWRRVETIAITLAEVFVAPYFIGIGLANYTAELIQHNRVITYYGTLIHKNYAWVLLATLISAFIGAAGCYLQNDPKELIIIVSLYWMFFGFMLAVAAYGMADTQRVEQRT